jgi:hypothetical protein
VEVEGVLMGIDGAVRKGLLWKSTGSL